VFQESEVVQLLLGLGLVPLLWLARIPRGRPGFLLFYAGAGVMLASWVLTVAEGVMFPVLLNGLEHLCHAVAGLLLLAACWTWAHRGAPTGEDPP
jgi:hypothetical protein